MGVTDARRQTGRLLSVAGAVSVPPGGGGAAHDRWIQARLRRTRPYAATDVKRMDAVGLFRPYNQKTEQAPEPVASSDAHVAVAGGVPKNRPTPTRQQAQAARLEAIHPKLTRRQMSTQDRAAADKKRQQQMAAADNLPERVLLRNYVDSRLSFAQFVWGIILLLLVMSIVAGRYPWLVMAVTVLMYATVLATIISVWWFWQGFKRELASRYPSASTKGLLMMMVSRMMMIPRMRQPAPVIKRGDEY